MGAKRCRAGPLTAEQRALCGANVRIAFWVVKRYYSQVPAYLREEMDSEALAALVRAALYYDPGRGVKYSSYATRSVWLAVSRWLSDRAARAARTAHPDGGCPECPHGWETVPGAAYDPWAARDEAEAGAADTRAAAARVPALMAAADLTPKERRAVCLYYGVGGEAEHTLEAAGKVMGLTKERVRQLCRAAEAKMREAAEEGV